MTNHPLCYDQAKEKASATAVEEVDPVAVSGGRKAVVRMDRDRETENEARKLNAKSPTKDKVVVECARNCGQL